MNFASVMGAGAAVLTGRRESTDAHSWFARLVRHFVHRYRKAHPAGTRDKSAESPDVEARRVIARTSLLSAASGAASGAVSTGAELAASAELGLFAIPAAMLAVGGEALLRIKLHVELTCALADMFEVEFDVDDPSDLWRLYALTFNTRSQDPNASEPDRGLISELTHSEEGELASELGSSILRETLLRNVIPGLSIATSAYTNYKLTHRLGDNVRRYMRYQRALHDAFMLDTAALGPSRALLIEGIWFVFSADGTLTPEETALLASLIDGLPAAEREALLACFTLDEQDWLGRLSGVDAAMADAFLRALEVAAAVDKQVSLPEQKILSRAAQALGTRFAIERTQSMIAEFEAEGVLRPGPVL